MAFDKKNKQINNILLFTFFTITIVMILFIRFSLSFAQPQGRYFFTVVSLSTISVSAGIDYGLKRYCFRFYKRYVDILSIGLLIYLTGLNMTIIYKTLLPAFYSWYLVDYTFHRLIWYRYYRYVDNRMFTWKD